MSVHYSHIMLHRCTHRLLYNTSISGTLPPSWSTLTTLHYMWVPGWLAVVQNNVSTSGDALQAVTDCKLSMWHLNAAKHTTWLAGWLAGWHNHLLPCSIWETAALSANALRSTCQYVVLHTYTSSMHPPLHRQGSSGSAWQASAS